MSITSDDETNENEGESAMATEAQHWKQRIQLLIEEQESPYMLAVQLYETYGLEATSSRFSELMGIQPVLAVFYAHTADRFYFKPLDPVTASEALGLPNQMHEDETRRGLDQFSKAELKLINHSFNHLRNSETSSFDNSDRTYVCLAHPSWASRDVSQRDLGFLLGDHLRAMMALNRLESMTVDLRVDVNVLVDHLHGDIVDIESRLV